MSFRVFSTKSIMTSTNYFHFEVIGFVIKVNLIQGHSDRSKLSYLFQVCIFPPAREAYLFDFIIVLTTILDHPFLLSTFPSACLSIINLFGYFLGRSKCYLFLCFW